MTPKEIRNVRLAERMIKNLKRRNMEAFYCRTAAEAVNKVSELIADGSIVTWGGSMTIRYMGIPQALKNRGTLEVLDRDVVADRDEVVKIYERAFKQGCSDCRGCTSTCPLNSITNQCSAFRYKNTLSDGWSVSQL